jgi:hypothetical protein
MGRCKALLLQQLIKSLEDCMKGQALLVRSKYKAVNCSELITPTSNNKFPFLILKSVEFVTNQELL